MSHLPLHGNSINIRHTPSATYTPIITTNFNQFLFLMQALGLANGCSQSHLLNTNHRRRKKRNNFRRTINKINNLTCSYCFICLETTGCSNHLLAFRRMFIMNIESLNGITSVIGIKLLGPISSVCTILAFWNWIHSMQEMQIEFRDRGVRCLVLVCSYVCLMFYM